MHFHILGICGTFMGSLALLLRSKGYRVTGCDQGVYPPMSTQLEEQGIELEAGFDRSPKDIKADVYVVGNAISRGNPMLESLLNWGMDFRSGPSVLAEYVLSGKWVLGVAGTHGKTTTTAMLAWILQDAGMSPGFLIGGVPANFEISARLGDSDFFVIEADEYDTCFDDKRSKFIHYRSRTLILNNLEFDHADIFDNLAAIQKQFHHLVRTVPKHGQIIYPIDDKNLEQTLEKGVWSTTQSFVYEGDTNAVDRQLAVVRPNPNGFTIKLKGEVATVEWPLLGKHNVANGVASMLAAKHVGISLETSAQALSQFKGVKRRLEAIVTLPNLTIYDDFAHHPTAIESTLEGLRKNYPQDHIIAVIEPRSNTMKQGVHKSVLASSAASADQVYWFSEVGSNWIGEMIAKSGSENQSLVTDVETVLNVAERQSQKDKQTHLVLMSNGGFSGLREKLVQTFEGRV